MNGTVKFNKNESGQAALEAAIILIAFVVVASVFAFAVLSAGSASTARGEQAIYAGLQEVQSSMAIKGSVIAVNTAAPADEVDSVVFTVALVSGGDPVNLSDGAAGFVAGTSVGGTPVVVIAYRDANQYEPTVSFRTNIIVGDNDAMLEEGELAEITATVPTGLEANMPFSLEVKPPTGAVLQVNRTTPAALEVQMELR